MNDGISRRAFLTGSLALASCKPGSARNHPWEGEILGASHNIGHLLRTAREGTPPPAEKADVIVAGGGMAGLIAAHRLRKAGRSVMVLDLESDVGGNAMSGSNSVSAYPWGAHYAPLPSADMTDVCDLLHEMNLGTPGNWDQRHICHAPDERLWIRGAWQEGLIPQYGLDAAARAEIARFLERMEDFKSARGTDGLRAFAIPAPLSSRDESFTRLDQITMAAWMKAEGFTQPDLRWYVDYACRDDYGADSTKVSAWAGIHYFASRDSHEVFTWPEGNGRIVRHLKDHLLGCTLADHLVTSITPEGEVRAIHARTGALRRWQADAVVCAMPLFITNRIVTGFPSHPLPQYSPWLVANLTVRETVSDHWDNVLREARGLGYVVANHQNLSPVNGPCVITYYRPLDHLPPADAREMALRTNYHDWCDDILDDLAPSHPDLARLVSRFDVWLWGHAMARPDPGFLTNPARLAARAPHGRIHFAHSDLSGIPIFEEACHWGCQAARAILS
jgi:glycine/D-amino acid oxidase-like deaminating enzyme